MVVVPGRRSVVMGGGDDCRAVGTVIEVTALLGWSCSAMFPSPRRPCGARPIGGVPPRHARLHGQQP